MNKLDEFLATIPSQITRAKAKATLEKRRGIRSDASLVLDAVSRGNATLSYKMGYGKKRDGLRAPTKPKWTIWSGDTGNDISRTAADFANFLLAEQYDLDSMERDETERYERELRAVS